MLTETRAVLDTLKPVRSMLRNLRVDIEQENSTDLTWLIEFDKTCETAWAACRALHERLQVPDPEPMMNIIADVVRAAKEVVQADHACLLGRTGCEQRWDKGMEELKKALSFVRAD